MRVKPLKRWLGDLPLADYRRTSELFVKQLETLNIGNYSSHERASLMDNLRPIAQQLVGSMSLRLRKAELPFKAQDNEDYELLQNLLEGMATGYKLIVNTLALTTPHREHDDMLLREAIYFASQYLSRSLLEAYLVYMPEPKNTWLELNQLYQYAEEHALHTLPVDDPFPDINLPIYYNIELVYKRIVLLSLAEPYHLMKGEAREFYYLLSAWAGTCDLFPVVNAPGDGDYVVDMQADVAPGFFSSELSRDLSDAYTVDISEVQKRLELHLKNILRNNLVEFEEEHHVQLQHRKQRDMLLRLSDAWRGTLKRAIERHNSSYQIKMATGLNAIHHYLSLGKVFTPEVDELKMQTDDVEAAFFASAYRSALQKDRYHINQSYNADPWLQSNFSEHGAALTCSIDCPEIHAVVGEVVTYCDHKGGNETIKDQWKVGLVRWLKTTDDEHLDMGIMNLARSAVPIAVKAIAGAGEGTDYFRAVLIPKQVSLQQSRCLLVPTHVYDINSVVTVNMKHRIFYVKLLKLKISTQSFSQFEFEIINKPLINTEELLSFK